MQEFLVNINIEWPNEMPSDRKQELTIEERRVAQSRTDEGHLVRMWRVPGRTENWGLWRAKDPTELHEILSGLPVWPYMNLKVHSLAEHPVDPKLRYLP